MKTIFDETKKVHSYEQAWARKTSSGRVLGDVIREVFDIFGETKASYDKKTRTLVIDQSAHCYQDYADAQKPEDRRIFETHPHRESALRSVIAHADAWYSEIAIGSPEGDANLTDEQVIERESTKVLDPAEMPF